MKPICLAYFFFILLPFYSISQTPTVGLIQHSIASFDEGYVLFAPGASTTTYLIDKCGRKIHSWNSAYRPGFSVYLLENGDLLRSENNNNTYFNNGGKGGRIEKIDWNGNVVWSYVISDSLQCQHHDIHPMPNGNILAIVWEKKSLIEAALNGRDTTISGASVWSEKIIELEPIGTNGANLVWEWHLWDHMVQDVDMTKPNYGNVSQHPELININYNVTAIEDWIHMNAIDYNEGLDQILLSNHSFNEIYIIDHSTSTLEAASHQGGNANRGGDLLWRWGNPLAYKMGTIQSKKLFSQHNPHWIKNGLPNAGNIMLFNNDHYNIANGSYSSIDIIAPPLDSLGHYSNSLPYQPSSAFWSYQDSIPSNFYSKNISGAQQLPNGNILICNGFNGTFFEIDSTKKTVWKYVNPVASYIYSQGSNNLVQNNVFRAPFYSKNFSGFANHVLAPGSPIELNPYTSTCEITATNEINSTDNDIAIYPNPCTSAFTIELKNNKDKDVSVKLFDIHGRLCKSKQITTTHVSISTNDLIAGLYILKIETPTQSLSKKISVE